MKYIIILTLLVGLAFAQDAEYYRKNAIENYDHLMAMVEKEAAPDTTEVIKRTSDTTYVPVISKEHSLEFRGDFVFGGEITLKYPEVITKEQAFERWLSSLTVEQLAQYCIIRYRVEEK